jgi:hypothetical protein
MNWVIKQAPVGSRFPLHVYANRDCIFVTCAGCSLLGRQAALLALESLQDDDGGAGAAQQVAEDGGATLKPGQAEQKIIKRLARMIGATTNGYMRRALRRESGLPMPNLLANGAEVEQYTSRFAHFCRLLFRDRQPLCPLNGVLVLAPLGATDTDLDAQQSADLLHKDLMVLRQVLKVQCPIFTLLVDVEQLPGFSDFLQRRSAGERTRRIGQRFPLAPPDLNQETYFEKLEDSVAWLTDHVVRDLAYRVFKVESGPKAKLSINHDLFLFVEEMRERKTHLSRFVAQGIARDADAAPLFGGSYMGGTGADREREQGFVRGVFQRLLDCQNYISWTDRALSDDARASRISFVGYLFLTLLVLALVSAFGYQYYVTKR